MNRIQTKGHTVAARCAAPEHTACSSRRSQRDASHSTRTLAPGPGLAPALHFALRGLALAPAVWTQNLGLQQQQRHLRPTPLHPRWRCHPGCRCAPPSRCSWQDQDWDKVSSHVARALHTQCVTPRQANRTAVSYGGRGLCWRVAWLQTGRCALHHPPASLYNHDVMVIARVLL